MLAILPCSCAFNVLLEAVLFGLCVDDGGAVGARVEAIGDEAVAGDWDGVELRGDRV